MSDHHHHQGNALHDDSRANGNGKLSSEHSEERIHRLERIVTAQGHELRTRQPAFPVDKIHRRLALPIPIAAYSIGATTWLLGLLLLQARNTTLPNAWIINGLPMGGFITVLAGVGEIFTGNTFGCALFLLVGGIVLGLASVFLPWTGIITAFAVKAQGNPLLTLHEVNVAAGIFVMVSFAILFILLIGSQRTAIAIVTSLIFIIIVAITFGVGLMVGNAKCITTAGAFLIITSANLFYNGTALLLLEVGHPLAKFFPLGSLAPQPKAHEA